jgi:hypothetical protein
MLLLLLLLLLPLGPEQPPTLSNPAIALAQTTKTPSDSKDGFMRSWSLFPGGGARDADGKRNNIVVFAAPGRS